MITTPLTARHIAIVQHIRRLALIVITLLGGAVPPSTASAADEQQRLHQLRSNINELRQDIGADKQQQAQLQQELQRLERDIAASNKRLRDIEKQLAEQRQTQQQLQSEIRSLEQKLGQQKQLLTQQLRASYTPNQQQTLKLLLNQSSPAEAGRTLIYYGYFSRAQLQTIDATRGSIDKLHAVNEQLQQGNDRLATLKQQQQQQQSELAASKAEQKQLLGKVDNRIQGNQKSLASMLADEQALSKLMKKLESKRAKTKEVPDSGKLKGKLQWPTQGRIEHSFGDSRNQGQMRWQGILISGKEGQEIRTIAPGKVVFADWMRGYGLLLIIDHGNNLMSLYGQNQSLHKKSGESVSVNDVVATLGDNDDGAGLYFELRHKGKPVDPEKWLR